MKLCFIMTIAALKSIHILKVTWLDKKTKYWDYLRKSEIGCAPVHVQCGRTLGSGRAFRDGTMKPLALWLQANPGKAGGFGLTIYNLDRSPFLQALVFLLVNTVVASSRTWEQTAPVKGWHRIHGELWLDYCGAVDPIKKLILEVIRRKWGWCI